MTRTLLLRYQVLYMLLGIGYNLVSIMMKRSGGRPLAQTNPVAGIAVMLLFGLFLIPGFLNSALTYRILMGVAVIALGYFGVITHLLNYGNLQLYYSPAVWILAIAINLFGLVLNLLAASGKFASL